MDEMWHATDESASRLADERVGTYIEVNGATIDVEPGSNLKEVVIRTARDAGLGKFRVFLNGEEVKPSQAPEVFNEGDVVRLAAYDVAG